MYKQYFKRISDIALSTAFIVVSLPLLLGITIILWIVNKRIFFFQERPGLDGILFTIYKFRTMSEEKDSLGDFLPDAQRLTSIGRFLRRTNLDELPQLLNVLFGTMSIVGPRPFLAEYLNMYTEEQKLRHCVKPGLTGWAQINGGNSITWEQKLALDLEYAVNQSAAFDIKILMITFLRIITLRGFDSGAASPEKFAGTSVRSGDRVLHHRMNKTSCE